MSASRPASDTFIGRLFRRIAPGSSYAAFPWKSWDKVCTILETIRGRGCRIKRSHKDNEWEIDATDGISLDKPHAYSVFVLDPKSATEYSDELPPVMMENVGEENPTVYCYLPCPRDDSDEIAGVNTSDMDGEFGDVADNEWPEGSLWGWKKIGFLESDDPMVVFGSISGVSFENISLATVGDFISEAKGGTGVVPIAWINGTNVVQALCGRPWQSGGGSDIVVCNILGGLSEGDDWSNGVRVALYENGPFMPSTGQGIVYFPEIGQSTKPIPTSWFVAHKTNILETAGTIEDEQ